MEWCEDNGAGFIYGLAGNSVLAGQESLTSLSGALAIADVLGASTASRVHSTSALDHVANLREVCCRNLA